MLKIASFYACFYRGVAIEFCNSFNSGIFNQQETFFLFQGILVPKLTLGPFLTLSVRNGSNLQSYLFQEYIYLNPRRERTKLHHMFIKNG